MYAGAAHLNPTLYGTRSPLQAFLTSSFLSTILLPPFIEIINIYKYTQLYVEGNYKCSTNAHDIWD